jgi:hypothetical protein
MNGVVQSGEHEPHPLRARVTLFEAGSGKTRIVGYGQTDRNGSFEIETPAHGSQSIFYATADVGDGVVLMALLGAKLPERITINELTTVAATYSAAQFLVGADIEGDSFGLRIAAGMNTNLVNVIDGKSSNVLLSSPNADETNALRTTRSLANLLTSCIHAPETVIELFFTLTTPPNGEAPANTVEALGNLARTPAYNAGPIYIQSNVRKAFEPALQQQPDAWTIAVKVNDSGDDAHMFGGPGNLVFDRHGRVWITNNVEQGTGKSTEYSIVLGPEGRPAVDAKGNRISPFTGGGLLGTGFGVALDSQERVWIGDFGWGGDNPKAVSRCSTPTRSRSRLRRMASTRTCTASRQR